MSFRVRTTKDFDKSAKKLAKRHRSLKEDLMGLVRELQANPLQGAELSPGIHKIRMAIKSKGGGKSGGARVITYTIVASENDGEVVLLDIYDKSDYSTVDENVLKEIVAELNKGK